MGLRYLGGFETAVYNPLASNITSGTNTVQTQGVFTLQQQAQAQSNQQWVTDPNFKNTTLLLQADNRANGSQNNTFLDSSTNNFTITRNGNTTQGSFSPFCQPSGYWSGYFLSGSSNIDFPTTTNLNLTGNFTIDFWFNLSLISATSYIFSGSGCTIQTASSNLVCYDGTANQPILTAPQPNTWYYIALVRSGTTVTPYVNGVAGTPFTNSSTTAFTHSGGRLGAAISTGGSPINGYISNYRVSNVARTISLPTAPYASDANTLALVCATNRFNDLGINNLTLTTGTGNQVQTLIPFAPALQWTPTVVGGSGYFDGTGDYLTTPTSSAFSLSGDFTYEAWVYCTSTSTLRFIMPSSVTMVLDIVPATGSNMKLQFFDGSATADAINTFPINAWAHVALVRSGSGSNNCAFYVNGVRGTQFTSSATNSSPSITIGNYSTQYYYGYIGTFRIVNGQAVYSGATYTVPNAPLTTTGYGTTSQSITASNTKLLLNYTNAGIYDGKMGNVLETVATAQVATSPVKYGSGSMYFSGVSPYSYLKGNANLSQNVAFGTGDFTIECWVWLTTTASDSVIIDSRAGANSGNYFLFYLWTAGGTQQPTIAWYVPTAYALSTGGSVSANVWTHIAVSRSNGIIRSFKDGVLQQSAANTTSYANPGAPYPYIGAGYGVSTDSFKGYMDDLRITNGVARYIANFTPPQQALPRQ